MTVEFIGLTKAFGPKTAVDNLSFRAEAGQVTGLLGRNGAGKTTALRSLVGLDSPTSGRALINGFPFEDSRSGNIGVALSARFSPTRRVLSQLQLSGFAAGASRSQVFAALEDAELTQVAHKRCLNLSLGMKQRLALACALVANPDVLILDEPVNGLDPDGIRWIHSLLQRKAAEGKTVLVSSHYLHDLQTYVDKVVIIQSQLLWQGAWPNPSEPSLEHLFSRVTAGSAIS